jgi:hypothetical protein
MQKHCRSLVARTVQMPVPELAQAKRQKNKAAPMSQLRQRQRAASARFLMQHNLT